MTNVIRPTFGAKSKPSVPPAGAGAEGFTILRDYGSAGGHMVALVRTGESTGDTSLCVLVGSDGGEVAMAVATLPDTADGEATAETVATAILRAFQFSSAMPSD